jgi:isobutyryl-CoA mutase
LTDLSDSGKLVTKTKHKVRFVTAASLFDGHDASINIMRRILQASGAEVIHLGHNRSVEEIVAAALQEDVQGIAVSSYQGGHLEYFKYMIDLLRERGGAHIKLFGGGGGVIVASEIEELQRYGVTRIYSPEDGQRMGLQGMVNDMLGQCDFDLAQYAPAKLEPGNARSLAQVITALELGHFEGKKPTGGKAPVLGITGTGGAGKSSLTDELVRRFRLDYGDSLKIAVLSVDPTRRKTGGALLGDRIRMNAIHHPAIFMRSLATRSAGSELSAATGEAIAACKAAGYELVIVETAGIGQGDAQIVPHVDVSLYVMTPEFGAASQLEKIDMLDFADFVAINKFDRKGAEDALRDVRKQVQRNREAFREPAESMPVYGTIAARFNDDGVSVLYHALAARLVGKGLRAGGARLPKPQGHASSRIHHLIPAPRQRYLAEIAETVRAYHGHADQQARVARERQQLRATQTMLGASFPELDRLVAEKEQKLEGEAKRLLDTWPQTVAAYSGDEQVVKVRDREVRTRLTHTSLSGTHVPKVALPRFEDHGELLRWRMRENLPGEFPFTGGVFHFKRENEDPTRMFAGEGDPFRTNRRFHLLSKDMPAKRLSTAFDSVTLYGFDPDERPDIYGKVGNSGVSIATLDDMKVLYSGFDLCDPATSVSMTINGPAPTILAMFFNTAIDQQVEKLGRAPTADEYESLKKRTLSAVRGTVQADILKEDQGQNTCIFSTEFSLKVMGDIQQYFIAHQVRNFYSVSISGYHIAEAGANPISQLAFTLANGFTFVEAYLARGMPIDDFAPNLSFFFSYGMDPEYAVLGRVARRIWAVAMRERYGANERSQKLKFHSQTSGRSLHAQEIAFNDIRTTLQALISSYDHTNSLHTNAYDEAITTPTEESVRRAMAIQLIINREFGLAKSENPLQGSYFVEWLTDVVEEAVLREFERISERGGVLGAMELQYQRTKIQEESLHYEQMKHDGTLPIIGVNTWLDPATTKDDWEAGPVELRRATPDEKEAQIESVRAFQARHADEAGPALKRLQEVAMSGGNVFGELMSTVRVATLGQISHALYAVGGEYRRNL